MCVDLCQKIAIKITPYLRLPIHSLSNNQNTAETVTNWAALQPKCVLLLSTVIRMLKKVDISPKLSVREMSKMSSEQGHFGMRTTRPSSQYANWNGCQDKTFTLLSSHVSRCKRCSLKNEIVQSNNIKGVKR